MRKTKWMRETFDETYVQAAMVDLFTGQALECMHSANFDTLNAMTENLCTTFKRQHFQLALNKRVQSGEVFSGCTQNNIVMRLNVILRELGDHVGGLVALAQATKEMFPFQWRQLKVYSQNLSAEEYQGALLTIVGALM
ncbi:hypothetical protein H4R24_000608 [Coemansia sp. RSA 988]|nr:hypothetical protein H4R24_000608 [Coemansia sp. RSA 988]